MAARLLVLAAPLVALGVLLAVPEADVAWKHQPAHFWLVLVVALASMGLGFAANEAARRLSDARLFLISLAFVASAGFFALHALATPGVLLAGKNGGFEVAMQAGLVVAGIYAAASAVDFSPSSARAVMARQRLLRGILFALVVGWAVLSLSELPPLDEPLIESGADGDDTQRFLLATAGIALVPWTIVVARYYRMYRRRPGPMLGKVLLGFVLVLEGVVVLGFGAVWKVTWWEWHVLLTISYVLIARTVLLEYRRARSAEGAFSALYLEHTLSRVDADRAAAVGEVLTAQRRGSDAASAVEEVSRRHGLSAEQGKLLERAAAEVRQLDELFRPYVSPQLAARLEADPRLAQLGGEERDVSVLFADLQGFTAFSERARPDEVIAMLNEYWRTAGPVMLSRYEGMIERFAGDAIMVVFNAAGDQLDHAQRAARAGLEMLEATEALAHDRPDWPRFRVGINTGPAVVGHVGLREQRSFAAIGDTVNLAARLQGLAQPGQVVVSGSTRAVLGPDADVESLGRVELKGKREPVEVFVLRAVFGASWAMPATPVPPA